MVMVGCSSDDGAAGNAGGVDAGGGGGGGGVDVVACGGDGEGYCRGGSILDREFYHNEMHA